MMFMPGQEKQLLGQ